MSNRLAFETSPYLLQHRDNPVDWRPWGEQALTLALAEDKPILLSIGYSTCHWCHVMAHECFEDEEVAARMNALFVNIKVDREERPDLDHIYQSAHQLLTGRGGGWPLTLFLAPDGMPFFAGTYFPKHGRQGLPGFMDLTHWVAEAYRTRRDDIERQNGELRAALAARAESAPTDPARAVVAQAVSDLKRGFDRSYGGFGGAPKFPRASDLDLLLRWGWQESDADARDMALYTLAKMAEGGLRDHLGGGFYRYSVDERWMIPHFEKMLYDNGLLLATYADAFALTREAVFEQAATSIVEWALRAMRTPDGGFHAAQDADSEGEEGRFYAWTPTQARAVLDEAQWQVAEPYFGLDAAPNFEHAHWHLFEATSVAQVAARLGLDEAEVERRLEQARMRLFEARAARVPPSRDDKMLAGWNALLIQGLARAGRRMARPEWVDAACAATDAVRARLWRDGRLYASFKDDRADLPAYLDDHAYLLDALLDLMQARFRAADFAWARELADALLANFEDARDGGFYFTAHDHETLIARPRAAHDSATPAGNAIAARALGRLAVMTDDGRYADAARRCLRTFAPDCARQPLAHAAMLGAWLDDLAPPSLTVLRGPAEALAAGRARLDALYRPDQLLLVLPNGTRAPAPGLDHPASDAPCAWVCRAGSCLPPEYDLTRLWNPRET
jgi:uncharacterized protein YyaL (SSP411 family)